MKINWNLRLFSLVTTLINNWSNTIAYLCIEIQWKKNEFQICCLCAGIESEIFDANIKIGCFKQIFRFFEFIDNLVCKIIKKLQKITKKHYLSPQSPKLDRNTLNHARIFTYFPFRLLQGENDDPTISFKRKFHQILIEILNYNVIIHKPSIIINKLKRTRNLYRVTLLRPSKKDTNKTHIIKCQEIYDSSSLKKCFPQKKLTKNSFRFV